MTPNRSWRNTTALIAVAAIGLVACGGGDDDTDGVPPAEESSSDDPDAGEATSGDQAGSDSSASDSGASDSGASDSGASDSGSSGSGSSISSIDDVPPQCRDALSDFLREIEPIVSETDWENASLADMETIGAEMESIGAEFDEESFAAGCDDLAFAENSFDVMIEFAQDEAPGTVGFLTFLDDFANMALENMDGNLGDPPPGDGSSSEAAFDDCASAIDYIEGLMSDYERITDAPLGEIASLGDLGFVMVDCTPEQLEFFNSPEANTFLGG